MPIGTKILKVGKAVLNSNKLFPACFYKQKVWKKKAHQKKCYVVLHFWQGQKAAGIWGICLATISSNAFLFW